MIDNLVNMHSNPDGTFMWVDGTVIDGVSNREEAFVKMIRGLVEYDQSTGTIVKKIVSRKIVKSREKERLAFEKAEKNYLEVKDQWLQLFKSQGITDEAELKKRLDDAFTEDPFFKEIYERLFMKRLIEGFDDIYEDTVVATKPLTRYTFSGNSTYHRIASVMSQARNWVWVIVKGEIPRTKIYPIDGNVNNTRIENLTIDPIYKKSKVRSETPRSMLPYQCVVRDATGRQHNLGRFATREEVALARAEFLQKHNNVSSQS